MSLHRKRAILLLFLACCKIGVSQLIVDTTRPVSQLVQKVLLGGNLVAYNIQYTGAHHAIGYFDGSRSNIGLQNGILMTTGSVEVAIGPNNLSNHGINNGLPGD